MSSVDMLSTRIDLGAGRERLVDLLERLRLDLDRQPGPMRARALDRRRDAAGQADVVVLDQDRVERGRRDGSCAPPARTAYFSSARSVGVVLRVSRTVMRPPAASTNRRARVAMPESRCRKLSAVRSPISSARAEPRHLGDLVAGAAAVAVAAWRAVDTHAGLELPERLERDVEAGEHAVGLGEEHAARPQRRRARSPSVVMSPPPTSSSSARRTMSR